MSAARANAGVTSPARLLEMSCKPTTAPSAGHVRLTPVFLCLVGAHGVCGCLACACILCFFVSTAGLAATHAADLFRNRRIDKIILTRPNVPCGRSLGFFPGSLEDKFAPWAAPVAEAIKERIGKAAYDIALKNGSIELVPFEVMRGRSWKNAFVLLDEAQNATPAEIKTFLTRIGDDCTVVINGDISQCDLPSDSGLRTVIQLVDTQNLPVPVIEFTRGDIVRSGICAMWVNAFEEAHL